MKAPKLLKALCNIQSYYLQEQNIKEYILNFVSKKVKTATIIQDIHGNLIIEKNADKLPFIPCICAHMDTVFKKVDNFEVIEEKGKLFTSKTTKAGIGGDDKAGIFIALSLLLSENNIKVVFFSGEEVGCIGANAIDLKHFKNCSFAIEPDRRGCSDLIFTYYGQKVCSKAFEKLVYANTVNYFENEGTYTDVMILKERGLAISVMNISCGYYNAHSNDEYIVVSEVVNTLKNVKQITQNAESKKYYHKFVDKYSELNYAAPTKYVDTFDYYADFYKGY